MRKRPIVAQIHPHYLGLSEMFIHRFVNNLTRWQAEVLTEHVQNGDYYEFGSRYRVREIGQVHDLPFRAWAKALRVIRPSLRAYNATHARYSKALVRIRPSLLHAQFGPTGWFVLPLKHFHHLPLVVSFHGQDASALLGEVVWRQRYLEVFSEADIITTPSKVMAERLVQIGCPAHKLRLLRYGIDIAEWPFLPRSTDGDTRILRVLMVGRLVEKKGVRYTLEAVAEARRTIPDIQMQIAGDGALRSQIEQQIAGLQLSEHVKLLGFIPNTQVRELMRANDVLLAPSVTAADGDEEGLPNVLIEASAAGLPIIATRHAGTGELVRDGESGFLVPERDSHTLAQSLITLAQQPDLRRHFAQTARRIVEAEFNLTRSVEHLELIYDDIISTLSR